MGFASRRSPPIFRESPSPNIWDSRQKDHPLLSEWVSLLTSGLVSTEALFRGHASHGIPFIKGFASISKRLLASEAARGIFSPTQVVSRTRDTSPEGVACFPFASRSPEAPARWRPQPAPGQPGDLQVRCAQLSIAIEESLFIASYIFMDRRLLHIESPLLMLPPLVLIQQRCVDPCPGRLRSPLHDSSRTIDAYSSHHRFSSRSNERYDQRVAYSDLPCTLKEAPF